MLTEPTAHMIDPMTGGMTSSSGRYEKKLKDLEGLYADSAAFKSARDQSGEDTVYQVEEKRPLQTEGDLIFGVTYMKPGRIGDEFYMTRGHIHARANRPETYYGESGEGLMLMESPEGETRILEVKPQAMIYVPPLWIHRSINTGPEPLVMSFCYPSDSGQDYSIIERSGGMATRIVADGQGWKAISNTSYRTRTTEEISAVYASCT